MLTRKDMSRLLTSGLKTEFMTGYKGIMPYYTEITTEVPSTKAEEIYAWLGDNPSLREWKDEKAPKSLLEHGFTIKNKSYEATIAVDRDAYADEQYNQISVRVRNLGMSARKGYDKELTTLIEAGHSTVCYDGQNFFDTDHSEGESGTQSNYASSGKALSVANLKLIVTAMRQFKSDTGDYVGVNPTHILVPTGLEYTAKEILNQTYAGVSNTPSDTSLAGTLKIIVSPYLENAGTVANSAWYLLDLSQGVRPFIFQNREPMKFVSMDKDTDQDNFMSKQMYYSAEARFAFGYGDWRFAYKAQG